MIDKTNAVIEYIEDSFIKNELLDKLIINETSKYKLSDETILRSILLNSIDNFTIFNLLDALLDCDIDWDKVSIAIKK